MAKIRVLHVLHGLNRGGIETLLMNIYRTINRENIQFDFAIVENNKCDYEDEILSLGGNIYRMPPISIKSIIDFYKKFGHLCQHYNIVHSHWNTLSAIILMIAQKNHVKCRIAHSHIAKISSGTKGLVKRFFKSYVKHYSTHQFACGIDAGIFLYGKDIVKKDSFKLIKNGINIDKFIFNPKTREKIRSQKGVSENTLVIGHVGRIGEQKNQLFVIEVFAEITKKIPNSLLWLIGTGSDNYIKKVKEKVKALSIDDKVLFIGNIPNVNEYLSAFDIYLFPSMYEGLSVALIEAQAAGLVCYTSDRIDVNSKVTDNVVFNSLLEPAVVWAERIIESLPVIRKNTKEELIREGYDITNTTKWLEQFYLSLI